MNDAVRVTGMVLSAMPIGEYDKRLVILTRERGKITVFARGARRVKSPLMAAANPFVFGTFEVREGRSSYSLASASVKEYFLELASMQPGVYYGFYFLELADYYGQEGNDEAQMLNLLYVALSAIRKGKISLRLIRRIYELRLLVVNGEYPDLFSCRRCGTEQNLRVLSLRENGIYCDACGRQIRDGWELYPATVLACQYIIASPMERLFSFTVKDEILDELERVTRAYLNRFVDRRLKSLEILEQMQELESLKG